MQKKKRYFIIKVDEFTHRLLFKLQSTGIYYHGSGYGSENIPEKYTNIIVKSINEYLHDSKPLIEIPGVIIYEDLD